MRSETTEFGEGTKIICVAGDRLDDVPPPHRDLLTPELRAAFAGPKQSFEHIAARCQFPAMARWLRRLVEPDRWELELIHTPWSEFAGYHWHSDAVRDASIALPQQVDLGELPPELRHDYSLVDEVDPTGFGAGGKLHGVDNLPALSAYADAQAALPVDVDRAWVWGHSPTGDLLFFTDEGRAGWYLIGPHQIHPLGDIGQAIEHVYAQMLAGKAPRFER